tara:strand:+ start:5850 stop:7448 length:1599 start_codon:yes stop_codon:yes gene_type:complete
LAKIKNLTLWHLLILIITSIFLIPILFIGSSVFLGFSNNFYHLYENLLLEYSLNSIYLVLGVSSLVTILGVSTAWLVTFFDFYGKRFFQWALILPLAVPPYLLAYVFTEFFDYSGTANNILRNLLGTESNVVFFPNIRTVIGAITVFGFTLYPYVYMVSRVALMNIPSSVIEASALLGKNSISTFFNLSIPLIRPAIIAGVSLVAMETLADFGAVQHFAIPTFTTGIFRTWTGLYDLSTALQLSTMLLLVIFIFLALERGSRRKIRYVNSVTTNNSYKPIQLKKLKNTAAFFICFIPVFIGFFLPVLELIHWSSQVDTLVSSKTIIAAYNTLYISLSAALLTCFIALLINFIVRSFGLPQLLNDLLSLGYAVPGLILAVGITKMFTSVDTWLINFDTFITGSILGLVLAYIIKSYAISNNVLNSAFTSIPLAIDESAQTLGASKLKLLNNIHIPLLKTGLLTAFLLVMAELIKELPATLILRPFNFDTLSVSVYLLASEERMFEAAFPGLVIIIFGLTPIYFLNKLILSNNK